VKKKEIERNNGKRGSEYFEVSNDSLEPNFEKILSLIQNIPINRNGEIVEEFEEGDKPGSSILDHKYCMSYFSVEGGSLSEVKERIDKAFSIMKEPKISFRDIIKFAMDYMKKL